MTRERLAELLDRLVRVRAGVFGDYCLDAYWDLDEGPREPSLETGKLTRGVRRQRYTLGGAGNVASNLADLGVGSVVALGVIGEDLFGKAMLALLHTRTVDARGMVIQKEQWETPVYAKPYLQGEELERFDFGRWNLVAAETANALAGALRAAVPELDVLIVNQQLSPGVYAPPVIDAINGIIREQPRCVGMLDARTMTDRFTGMAVKLNASEAERIAGEGQQPGRPVSREELLRHVNAIAGRNCRPVFVTRGVDGILLCDAGTFSELPAVPPPAVSDPVGAGDTTVAAIAAALAAGATPLEAGELGNLAAAVTVRKLRETGTATPAEILRIAERHPGVIAIPGPP